MWQNDINYATTAVDALKYDFSNFTLKKIIITSFSHRYIIRLSLLYGTKI